MNIHFGFFISPFKFSIRDNSGTVITAFGKVAPEPIPFIGSALRGVGTLHIHLLMFDIYPTYC